MHLLLKTLGITLCKRGAVSLQRAVTFARGQEVSQVWGTADERLSSGKTLIPHTALFYFPGSSAGNS